GAQVDVIGGPNWTSPLTVEPYMRNPSLKNFSPRVGFAYDVTGNGKTAIRSAFGLYYDVATIGSTTFGYVVGDPPYRSTSVALPPSWAPGFISANPGPYQPPFANPGATSTFAGFSPLSPISITQHDIRQPYLMQWNLSLDQQLPGSVGLSVSYVGTRGLHLWGQGDVNPCIPRLSSTGTPTGRTPRGQGVRPQPARRRTCSSRRGTSAPSLRPPVQLYGSRADGPTATSGRIMRSKPLPGPGTTASRSTSRKGCPAASNSRALIRTRITWIPRRGGFPSIAK